MYNDPYTANLRSAGLPVSDKFPITVGGGGSLRSSYSNAPSGSNSVFSTITSAVVEAVKNSRRNGGSGSGGNISAGPGGAGNTHQ